MRTDRRFPLELLAAVVLTVIWFQFTPSGLLGKADAVGYAVCHRIALHSFHLGERPLSLCARCSGQYLGFALGLIFQVGAGSRRAGGLPGKGIRVLAVILGAAYAADGLNSVLTLQPGTAGLALYPPRNELRFLTGFGAGLALSLFFLPYWNRLIWQEPTAQPTLSKSGWLGLAGAALAVIGLYLTGNPLVLYPLTLAAAAGVILVLAAAYSAAWVILLRWENQFRDWSDLIRPAALGFTTALMQIAALDLIRYWLTGSWSGFHLG
jgi:uncharacterized membrane protein